MYVPLLLVHLDVTYHLDASHSDHENMAGYRDTWLVVILIQSVYVWIICPLTIVYYEGNERDSITKRIKKAF